MGDVLDIYLVDITKSQRLDVVGLGIPISDGAVDWTPPIDLAEGTYFLELNSFVQTGALAPKDSTTSPLHFASYSNPFEVHTSVDAPQRSLAPLALRQAYPNPFNPRTTITYLISQAGQVKLDIYDLAGRHVSTLVSEHVDIGEHQVQWNGKDDTGSQVASGVYLYQLRAGDLVETKRMVLLK